MPLDETSGIWWERRGEGPALMLGPAILENQGDIIGPPMDAVLERYLARLTDRFTVVTLDYPGIGKSADIDPATLTAGRVCADFLKVADAAGFDRFTYWGTSWGAAMGLQLALRTDRLDALILGAWTPLGAPYARLLQGARNSLPDPEPGSLRVLRSKAQYSQWVALYESLEGFDDAVALASISCPRLAYAGELGDSGAGGLDLPIASTLKARRAEIEAAGWRVELLPGLDHGGAVMGPDAVIDRINPFLDEIASRDE
ncbi:MAG: alpha/beta fold hydrolase [Oceanicaulis sp.]